MATRILVTLLVLFWLGGGMTRSAPCPNAIRAGVAPESEERARSLHILGEIAFHQGNLPAAKQYFQRALAIQEQLVPHPLAAADSLNNLGIVSWVQGDVPAAKEYHQRALALREKLAPNSLAVADSLGKLGVVAAEQGNLPAAKEYFQRALVIQEQLAPASLAGADISRHLGEIAFHQGDPPAATEYFQRALAIQEQLAPDSQAVATILHGLGAVALHQDNWAAKEYFQRALAIQEKLAPGSLDMASSLVGLGEVDVKQGELARAKEYFRRALVIQEQLAPDSLAGAGSLHLLGRLANTQGDLAAAKQYHQRALALREKLAPGSPDVASSLNELGTVVWGHGDLPAAKEYFQRALAIQEQLAPDSLAGAGSLHLLGRLANTQGDLAAAKQYHQRALALREKLAPGSLAVAGSLGALGDVNVKQGELTKARDYYQRTLAIRERLAPDSLAVATSLWDLAELIDESGDRRAAIDAQRRAISIYDEKAPESAAAPSMLRSLVRMLLESQEAGATAEAQRLLQRASEITDRIRSLPREPQPAEDEPHVQPQVRFLALAENSVVSEDSVALQLAFLAPLPLARYRVWVNGRPSGEPGFDLPEADGRGRPLQKGRLLEKGDGLGDGRVFEKGRLLEKGEDREALAKELPQELAALVKQPQYAYLLQIRHTVPVEDTDGQFLRIAVQAETTGGTVSDRQILRLRRPQAEQMRGSLHVLTIGVGTYQNLPKLKYAPSDAVALVDALRAQAGEADDHRLYRGATTVSLVDGDATLARIREELDRLVDNTRPGDTVLVALSGHGIKKRDATYFTPVHFDPENAEGTGLPWNEVLAKLERARKVARAVWILADCCRAAAGLRRGLSPENSGEIVAAIPRDLKRGMEEGGNLIVVTASSGDSPSYESEDLRHGIFTQAWLEALRGEAQEILYDAAPRGRVLTLSGLQRAVDFSVIQHSRRAGVRQRVEFPRLEGSFSPSTPVFVPMR